MPTLVKYKCLKCTADFELSVWDDAEAEQERKRRPLNLVGPKCKYCHSDQVMEAGKFAGRSR